MKKLKLKSVILFIAILILFIFIFYLILQGKQLIQDNNSLSIKLMDAKKSIVLTDEIHSTFNNVYEQSSSRSFYSVELVYNSSTGELYPIMNDGMNPHTCIWSIYGDHGSDTVLVTSAGGFYSLGAHDYVGHVLSNDIDIIKDNRFLPPRLPIYVACVDWNNVVYRGFISYGN